jgi:hypothetical protein
MNWVSLGVSLTLLTICATWFGEAFYQQRTVRNGLGLFGSLLLIALNLVLRLRKSK